MGAAPVCKCGSHSVADRLLSMLTDRRQDKRSRTGLEKGAPRLVSTLTEAFVMI